MTTTTTDRHQSKADLAMMREFSWYGEMVRLARHVDPVLGEFCVYLNHACEGEGIGVHMAHARELGRKLEAYYVRGVSDYVDTRFAEMDRAGSDYARMSRERGRILFAVHS
jgi:hypothetical protein